TAPGTNCSDIIDSFGPPLKRYISYYDCPRNRYGISLRNFDCIGN
ncbi:hypothetical protein JTB14_035180, partial [Gonioctena quinquepunctata]